MAIPLMAAGAVIGAYGAIKSNMDQADAEQRNADYFAEQASYAQSAGDRELAVFQDKYSQLRGQQVGAYASGGVDLSGSPLLFLEGQALKKEQETTAIKDETARRVRLASLKGADAQSQADNYSSFWTNFTSAAPSILNGAGSISKAGA